VAASVRARTNSTPGGHAPNLSKWPPPSVPKAPWAQRIAGAPKKRAGRPPLTCPAVGHVS